VWCLNSVFCDLELIGDPLTMSRVLGIDRHSYFNTRACFSYIATWLLSMSTPERQIQGGIDPLITQAPSGPIRLALLRVEGTRQISGGMQL
jgi:hypothetical protein